MQPVQLPPRTVQLGGRLRLGGRWYVTGDVVLLDAADADVYETRGLASPAPAGTKPKNVVEEAPSIQLKQTVFVGSAHSFGTPAREDLKNVRPKR